MSKYICNSCQNTFKRIFSTNLKCPVCKSIDVEELHEEGDQGSFIDEYGVLISFIVIAVMLIALILVPYIPHKYIAQVTTLPDSCKIKVVVSEYNQSLDPAYFTYSFDDGKEWHSSNELVVKKPDDLLINIKSNNNPKDFICYAFTKPYHFEPAASCTPDPCACQNLRIDSVVTFVNSKDKKPSVIIYAFPKNCLLEYSITGKNGIYQSDNIFPSPKPGDSVVAFIKSSKCTPTGYRKNPILIPKQIPNTNTRIQIKRYYNESELRYKPYPPGYEDRAQLIQYLKEQIQDMGIHGEIIISFTVETLGNLSSFRNKNNADQARIEKIIGSINALGNWHPGYKDNDPVDTYVTIDIPSN